MEHSICMFIKGKSEKFSLDDLAHLIEVAGVDNTILGSDLGLVGLAASGRRVPQHHPDPAGSQMPRAAIKKLISENAAAFLNLPPANHAAA